MNETLYDLEQKRKAVEQDIQALYETLQKEHESFKADYEGLSKDVVYNQASIKLLKEGFNPERLESIKFFTFSYILLNSSMLGSIQPWCFAASDLAVSQLYFWSNVKLSIESTFALFPKLNTLNTIPIGCPFSS